MLLVGEYSGIGKVYAPHDLEGCITFEKLKQKNPQPISEFESIIAAWLKGDTSRTRAVFAAEIVKHASREAMEALERRGVSCVRYNADQPMGGYALDVFTPSSPLLAGSPVAQIGKDDLFVLHCIFHGKFAIASAPPCAMTKDEIEKAGFADIDATAQVVALCRNTGKKSWEWGPSRVFPDGQHIQPALTAAEQYAQSCFEGMVATVNKGGEIVLFRPDRNAARFAQSCEALAMPPVSTEQFVDSVKIAVLANKKYLPAAGSSTKLYIRPYAKGLDGGYGVGPADSYLFAVEVFPYGDYFSGAIDIVNVPGARRSHEGGFGAIKASGNYGQTILSRVRAKAGLLNAEGKIYHDTFYFGERKTKLKAAGKTYTVVEDIIDEDSAGNLFFLKNNDGEITVCTAPLDRKAILPGVTRDSLLALARHAGFAVVERELTWDDIEDMDAAFVSGTAAGMVRIRSMTCDGVCAPFKTAEEDAAAKPVDEALTRLCDLLFAARRGELRDVTDHGIKDWAVVIGKV
ncbi:MAG: aminotransferase class IV [Bdellovibrionales bacterium]